jgi:hypothetical protein
VFPVPFGTWGFWKVGLFIWSYSSFGGLDILHTEHHMKSSPFEAPSYVLGYYNDVSKQTDIEVATS